MVLSPANVRQFRQINPFRYHGEKTWLVPAMAKILQSLPKLPNFLLETFAGGASIGLAAADQGLARQVLLVERDPDGTALCSSPPTPRPPTSSASRTASPPSCSTATLSRTPSPRSRRPGRPRLPHDPAQPRPAWRDPR